MGESLRERCPIEVGDYRLEALTEESDHDWSLRVDGWGLAVMFNRVHPAEEAPYLLYGNDGIVAYSDPGRSDVPDEIDAALEELSNMESYTRLE